MDLETLDRDELEARAARHGVDNPQHKTRRQLIQAIGGSERSTASRTFDAARSLFEFAATVARTLRPSRPLRPIRPPEARPTAPMRTERSPDERSTVPLKTAALRGHADNIDAQAEAVLVAQARQRDTVSLKPASIEPTAPEAETTTPETTTPETVKLEAVAATSKRAPAKVSAAKTAARAPRAEPVATQTFARLLDEQGHHRRALAIYETLVSQRPEDTELKRELEGARARAKGRRVRTKTPDEAETEGDAVLALRVDASTALVSWQLDHELLEQARGTLATAAPLTVRALIVAPSDTDFVQREVRTAAADDEGVWLLNDLPSDAYASVALGWELDSGFQSLAHARTLAMS